MTWWDIYTIVPNFPIQATSATVKTSKLHLICCVLHLDVLFEPAANLKVKWRPKKVNMGLDASWPAELHLHRSISFRHRVISKKAHVSIFVLKWSGAEITYWNRAGAPPLTWGMIILGLPHTNAFFMLRVASRHDASGYNFSFLWCFILYVDKLPCLYIAWFSPRLIVRCRIYRKIKASIFSLYKKVSNAPIPVFLRQVFYWISFKSFLT